MQKRLLEQCYGEPCSRAGKQKEVCECRWLRYGDMQPHLPCPRPPPSWPWSWDKEETAIGVRYSPCSLGSASLYPKTLLQKDHPFTWAVQLWGFSLIDGWCKTGAFPSGFERGKLWTRCSSQSPGGFLLLSRAWLLGLRVFPQRLRMWERWEEQVSVSGLSHFPLETSPFSLPGPSEQQPRNKFSLAPTGFFFLCLRRWLQRWKTSHLFEGQRLSRRKEETSKA